MDVSDLGEFGLIERLARAVDTRPARFRFQRRSPMPFYLMRFSYTPEAWSRLIKQPEDRRKVAGALIESLGGKLHGFWYGFGKHDGYVLLESPDNLSAAAFSVGIAAGGALQSSDTTVLMTVEETLEMLQKAQTLPYRQPGEPS